MKKLSMRGSLLLGVLLAVCAFVPALSSAASWSQVGTTHQLISNDLAFTAHTGPIGTAGSICQNATFDTDVTSAATLRITGTRFDNCHGSGNAVNCTATVVGTNFSWDATAITTTDLRIHGVSIDILFENTPGNPTACAAPGAKVLLTGTLSGGTWTTPANQIHIALGTGLTAHYLGLGAVVNSTTTVSGNIRDLAGTLRVFD